MPPSWMWPFPTEIERWFEQVREDRRARAAGEHVDRDDPPMARNELLKHW